MSCYELPVFRMAFCILVEFKSNREIVSLGSVAYRYPMRTSNLGRTRNSKYGVERGPQFSHWIKEKVAAGDVVAKSATNKRRWVTIVICIAANVPGIPMVMTTISPSSGRLLKTAYAWEGDHQSREDKLQNKRACFPACSKNNG